MLLNFCELSQEMEREFHVRVCRSLQSDDGSLYCSVSNASGFGSLHEFGNTSASATHIDRIPMSVYHFYIGDSSHGSAVPRGTADWSVVNNYHYDDYYEYNNQPAPNDRNCDQWGMKEGINLCALLTTLNLVRVWWRRMCTTTTKKRLSVWVLLFTLLVPTTCGWSPNHEGVSSCSSLVNTDPSWGYKSVTLVLDV